MASYYAKIDQRKSGDEKYRALSSPQPNGKSLWDHLLTCPQKKAIPGLISVGAGALADDLGWESSDIKERFKEIEDQGMASADWTARVVLIPNVIRYDPPANPNVIKGWVKHFDAIPECRLKAEWVALVWEFLNTEFAPQRGGGDAFKAKFRNCFEDSHPEAFANPSERVTETLYETLPGTLPERVPQRVPERVTERLPENPIPHSPYPNRDTEYHNEVQEQPELSPELSPVEKNSRKESGFVPPPMHKPEGPPKQSEGELLRNLINERGATQVELEDVAGGPEPWSRAQRDKLIAWLKPRPKLTDAEADRRRAARGPAPPRDGPAHVASFAHQAIQDLDPSAGG